MSLLISQKDQIYKIIEAYGLSPSQFTIKTFKGAGNNTGSLIVFTNTKYSFLVFLDEGGNFICTLEPGKEKYSETYNPGDWKNTVHYFASWLKYLDREITSPNYWERLQKDFENIKISNYDDDVNKFSYQEFEEMKGKIELLRVEIKSLGLSQLDVEAINFKLDHLVEMGKNLSKIDWKNLFIGSMFSITIQLAFTPSYSNAFFQIIKKIFTSIFLSA